MADEKTNKIEREYVIPLRGRWSAVPRYKRANKAVKAVKEFLVRHMKIYDRDLNKIKVDKYINEEIWHRGIKNPPARIRVKAIKEGDIVRVELLELPEQLKFKKAREEKREKVAEKGKPKTPKHEHKEGEEHNEESEKKVAEEKEKKATSIEATQKMEKDSAKKMKHQTKQSKEPKHPVRQALQK